MIVLFTDFGVDGPYVGQMKSVLAQQVPAIPIVDLLHSAPRFNPRVAAHFLAAYVSDFPLGSVILAVIDPGVGSDQRRPMIAEIAGRWFVGPANGLFDVLIARALAAQQGVACWDIDWRPEKLSNSFHGRDLFAPVAARLARGEAPPGKPMPLPEVANAADDLLEVIYLDAFGNAMTGLRAENVDASASLLVNGQELSWARTFAEVAVGQAFWYENANGLVEIAVNQGSVAAELKLSIGTCVIIRG